MGTVPQHCRILKITDSKGKVKEMIFPKALDLNRPKRQRTVFSSAQLAGLEEAFQRNPYMVGEKRLKLAINLGLTDSQVKIWFQNRRTKKKRKIELNALEDEYRRYILHWDARTKRESEVPYGVMPPYLDSDFSATQYCDLFNTHPTYLPTLCQQLTPNLCPLVYAKHCVLPIIALMHNEHL